MRNNTNTFKHLLAALLTIAALAAGHTTAWAQEDIAGLTYNSEGGYYEIPDAEAFNAFATYIKNTADGSGKTFKLTGDITYTHGNGETENNFTPIGTNGYSFHGTLDGQGHVISGIRIYQTTATYRGLFNKIESCTVKNIVLNDARITGNEYVGGITGEINNGSVQNCLVLNSVITETKDNNNKGVIAGNFSYVSGCSNNLYRNCTVNGKNYSIGSYVADRTWACEGFTISLPAGVSATSGKSLTYSGVTYHGSYENTVTLTYDNLPDGKAPFFTVTRTSDAGLVAETSGSFTMPKADVTVSVELRDALTLSLPAGVTASGTTITLGLEERYLAGTNVTLSYPTLSEGYEMVYSVNGTPIAGNTFEITSNTTVTVATNDVWGIGAGADGESEATAYVITTPAGLNLLAKKVDGTAGYSQNYYDDKFFKLDNDIVYTHTTDWNATASTENNYAPIGQRGVFKGSFDGQGYTISGIRIFRGGNTYDADSYLGIFSYVREGTVKNVTVSDTRITGYEYVGGIVAYNEGGTVSNCHVTNTVAIHAVIDRAESHGGIVGNNTSSGQSSVTGCTSAATLSMADGLTFFKYVGGIVGYNSGLLENCLAFGANVSGTNNVGALAGFLSNNYYCSNIFYKNCTVNGTPYAANVGCGSYESMFSGSGSGDLNDFGDKARGIGRITLCGNATVSGGSTVSVDAVTHYYSFDSDYDDYVEITLGHGEAPAGYGSFTGYTVKDASGNDVTVNENAGVYTFYMPACDVTVSATWTANAELEITSISATLFGEATYVTTFYNGTLDYQLPEGAKAYTASLDGSNVVFHLIGEDGSVIPKNTAAIVVANADNLTLTKLASTEVTSYDGNILRGSDTAVTVTDGKVDGKTSYVLGIDNSTLGFYKFSGDTIPAGKAYYVVE